MKRLAGHKQMRAARRKEHMLLKRAYRRIGAKWNADHRANLIDEMMRLSRTMQDAVARQLWISADRSIKKREHEERQRTAAREEGRG